MIQFCRKIYPFILCVFFTSCLGGIDKAGSVLSYRKGLVTTEGGAFRLGVLGSVWKQKKIDVRALVFVNSQDGATITVDSWCKGAFDDAALATLADQVFLGYLGVKPLSQKNFRLDGREALQKAVAASLDGVPVYLNVVVLKMNGCVFDFVYVSTPQSLPSQKDFQQMVDGFHYLRGPNVL